MADIGKLNVVIGATTTGLTAGLKAAKDGLNTFGRMSSSLLKPLKNVTAAIGTNGLSGALIAIPGPMGVAAVAADGMRRQLVAAAQDAARAQRQFDSLGDRINASANAMRRLGFLERSTGVSGLSQAAGSVRGMIGRAAAGVDADVAALSQLNLNLRELQNLDADEQLRRIGQALNAMADPAQRAAAGFRIFGDSYSSIRRALESGAMNQSGGVSLTSQQQQNLRELNTQTERLSEAWSGLTTEILANLAPHMSRFAQKLTSVIEVMTQRERELRTLSTGAQTALGWAISLTPAGPAVGLSNAFQNFTGGQTPTGGQQQQQQVPQWWTQATQWLGNFVTVSQELARLQAELDTSTSALRRQNQVAREIDPIQRGLVQLQQQYGRALEGTRREQARYQLMLQEAIRLEQQHIPALAQFTINFRRINSLASSGLLSPQAGAAAATAEFERIAAAIPNAAQNQLPTLLQEGTAASVSAVNQAIREATVRGEDPQERVRRVLEQQVEVQRQTVEYQRRIYEAIRQQVIQPAPGV